MRNGQKLLHWGTLCACVLTLTCGPALAFASPASASPASASSAKAGSGKPAVPDVILVAPMAAGKTLEMPPAVFPHDKHVREVFKKEQGCSLCHSDLRESVAFRNLPGKLSGKAAENAFHKNCITCHAQWDDGPQAGECRQCHDPEGMSKTLPVVYDKSLHALHVESAYIPAPEGADGRNCGVCHHVLNPDTNKLVWAPGQEEACAVCHGQTEANGVISLQEASHRSCVACHAGLAKSLLYDEKANADAPKADSVKPDAAKPDAAKPDAAKPEKPDAHKADKKDQPASVVSFKGPATCAGCHGPKAQAEFPRLKDIPRLMRGQPDATIILPANNAGTAASLPGTSMAPVVFNHKAHEAATPSCRVCHHVRISDNGCSSCHTVEGNANGNNVTQFTAMHKPDATASCVGCHQQTTLAKPECAGCHVLVQPAANAKDSCAVCHQPVQGLPSAADALKLSKQDSGKAKLQHIAEETLAARNAQAAVKPLSPADVPETVSIGILANEYQPVTFPHRKIYAALVDGLDKNGQGKNGQGTNGLAAAFHTSDVATCAACHHNVPESSLRQPPKCVTCHNDKAAPVVAGQPVGLVAAYHQQCLACHEAMQVKPVATDCAGCHSLSTAAPGKPGAAPVK